MPINFLEAKCSETTNVSLFGLCDAPPPSKDPAYISYEIADKTEWIAEVENNSLLEVVFTAVDNCIDVKRSDGSEEQRCEGFLTYSDVVIFVELKNRASKGWISKGRDQLMKTIELFSLNHDISLYNGKRAHIANKQRPFFEGGFQQTIDTFKADTGFTLQIQSTIKIQ